MKSALQGVISIMIKLGSVQVIKNVMVHKTGLKKDDRRSEMDVRNHGDGIDQNLESGLARQGITTGIKILRKEIGRGKEIKETGM